MTLGASSPSCGDDETSSVVVSQGPPAVIIVAPNDGDCVVLHRDGAEASVGVQIAVQNWSLRPQGFCGDVYSQCGFAVFLVDGQEVVRSAAQMTDVPVGGLPSPAGSHRIRVELRNDGDVVQLDDEGEPLAAEVNVDAADACP